jgi:uncharacterized protein (UPF0212 family)
MQISRFFIERLHRIRIWTRLAKWSRAAPWKMARVGLGFLFDPLFRLSSTEKNTERFFRLRAANSFYVATALGFCLTFAPLIGDSVGKSATFFFSLLFFVICIASMILLCAISNRSKMGIFYDRVQSFRRPLIAVLALVFCALIVQVMVFIRVTKDVAYNPCESHNEPMTAANMLAAVTLVLIVFSVGAIKVFKLLHVERATDIFNNKLSNQHQAALLTQINLSQRRRLSLISFDLYDELRRLSVSALCEVFMRRQGDKYALRWSSLCTYCLPAALPVMLLLVIPLLNSLVVLTSVDNQMLGLGAIFAAAWGMLYSNTFFVRDFRPQHDDDRIFDIRSQFAVDISKNIKLANDPIAFGLPRESIYSVFIVLFVPFYFDYLGIFKQSDETPRPTACAHAPGISLKFDFLLKQWSQERHE